MSISDPLADMFTRIRNAVAAQKLTVQVPASRMKRQICEVLLREGYITAFEVKQDGARGVIHIGLKYVNREPVLKVMRRVSRPSLRAYVKSQEIRAVRSGLGIAILTTSRGLMTGRQARQAHVGGEIICELW